MQEFEHFDDRRIFKRFAVKIPLEYTDPLLKKKVCVYTHDISVKGISLFLEKKLNLGAILEMKLFVPGNKEELLTKGKVIWLKPEGNGYKTGLKLEGHKLNPISMVLKTVKSQIINHCRTNAI